MPKFILNETKRQLSRVTALGSQGYILHVNPEKGISMIFLGLRIPLILQHCPSVADSVSVLNQSCLTAWSISTWWCSSCEHAKTTDVSTFEQCVKKDINSLPEITIGRDKTSWCGIEPKALRKAHNKYRGKLCVCELHQSVMYQGIGSRFYEITRTR